MEHSEVTSLDMILAVITNGERDAGVEAKHNQNGGMRCSFDNEGEFKIKGYWKPCTPSHLPQNSESFTAEIIAFYIDRILGFYRTPVVVPRTFNQSDFSSLSSQAIVHPPLPPPPLLLLLFSLIGKSNNNNNNNNNVITNK